MKQIVILFVLICLIACNSVPGKYSQFNFKKPLESPATSYSFLVGGHLYGKQNSSFYPANTLTSNVSALNESGASFFVALGDIVRETDSSHFEFFSKLFTDNLRIPFYNAVGNHDVKDRQLYESLFGKTFFHFTHKEDLFVFLDTEIDSARISGRQLIFLKKTISNYQATGAVGNVFVFMHKLIWNGPDNLQVVQEHSNQTYTWLDSNYFSENLEPLFEKTTIDNPVFIFSGDIGTPVSFTLFYHYDNISGINYIANGLGDTEDDALIKVLVGDKHSVKFEILSLTDKKFGELESYDLEFWEEKFYIQGNSTKKVLVIIVAATFILTLVLLYLKKKHESGIT